MTLAQDPTSSAGLPRWSFASALFGGIVWLVTPALPVAKAPPFGSLEHVFVFFPLVAAPLALALLARMLDSSLGSTSIVYRTAQRVQPIAAAMIVASFLLGKGPRAAVLTVAWLIMAIMIAVAGLPSVKRSHRPLLSSASLTAAMVFLPIGAVWLFLSRLGVGPANFAPITVLLAAVHFHFSGFTLQVLIAATARDLVGGSPRLAATHRGVAVGAIASIPLIALGNVLAAPGLKFVGVSAMVVSVLFLAGASTKLALASRASIRKTLLLVAAASVTVGMLAAMTYGIGELTGANWIGVNRMAAFHGLLNAVGFTFAGLLAHVHSSADTRQRKR